MVDREKVLTVLTRRFPGARPDQVAAAANAIVGLEDEWEDVTDAAQPAGRPDEIRVFSRRKAGGRR
jgi:hypothetical protein